MQQPALTLIQTNNILQDNMRKKSMTLGGERIVEVGFEDVANASEGHPLPSPTGTEGHLHQLKAAQALANNPNYQKGVKEILTALQTRNSNLVADLMKDQNDFICSPQGLGIDSAVESTAKQAVISALSNNKKL